MAELYRFFDGTASDPRSYSADDFAEYFRQFIRNGVFNGGDELQVSSQQVGLKTYVKPGKAWIDGYFYKNTDNLFLDHNASHATMDRIDRVVLRIDYGVRTMGVRVLTGVPGATPQPPALTRNNNVYELSLAQVKIKAGAVSVSPTNIVDERFNGNVCGIVTHLFEKVDTTDIFAQFESEWERWFGEIEDTTNLVPLSQFNTYVNSADTRFATLESNFDNFMDKAGFASFAQSYRALKESLSDEALWDSILNDPDKVIELILSNAVRTDPTGEIFTKLFKEPTRFMEVVFSRANYSRLLTKYPIASPTCPDGYLRYLDGSTEVRNGTAESAREAIGFVLLPKIKLDGLSVLNVDWSNDGSDHPYNESNFGIKTTEDIRSPNRQDPDFNDSVALTGRFARRITTLDVSGLSGEYYVGVIASSGSSRSIYRSTIQVYNIWGE